MSPSELEVGATYTNGWGATRHIVSLLPNASKPWVLDLVWYERTDGSDGECSTETFARWATARVAVGA